MSGKHTLSKVEAIKQQAEARGDELYDRAKKEMTPDLYDAAGKYYYTAGMNAEANHCWNAADILRRGEKLTDEQK